jgi:hypothetical protein
MAATHLIVLLSVGSFQALLPGIGPQPSPVFEDNAQGARAFTTWAKQTMPVPGFNQPPLRICVVGAVAFKPEAAPYLPKPLYESTFPLRALEPYSATFHYVEDDKPDKAGKPPKPRTMKQAQKICAEAAKKPPPSLVIPPASAPTQSPAKAR